MPACQNQAKWGRLEPRSKRATVLRDLQVQILPLALIKMGVNRREFVLKSPEYLMWSILAFYFPKTAYAIASNSGKSESKKNKISDTDINNRLKLNYWLKKFGLSDKSLCMTYDAIFRNIVRLYLNIDDNSYKGAVVINFPPFHLRIHLSEGNIIENGSFNPRKTTRLTSYYNDVSLSTITYEHNVAYHSETRYFNQPTPTNNQLNFVPKFVPKTAIPTQGETHDTISGFRYLPLKKEEIIKKKKIEVSIVACLWKNNKPYPGAHKIEVEYLGKAKYLVGKQEKEGHFLKCDASKILGNGPNENEISGIVDDNFVPEIGEITNVVPFLFFKLDAPITKRNIVNQTIYNQLSSR